MENILKVFLMAFPEWLACIFMVVGLVVTALAAVRLGYGLVVAKTVYKWIVNAEEKFGSGAGAEKKAHVIAVLRGYTPDWLDWAINERTLDWIVQLEPFSKLTIIETISDIFACAICRIGFFLFGYFQSSANCC